MQRLRELVPGRDEEDDETLRDRLDEALAKAEDAGRAIRTLDAMLGEPQTLIPVDAFGDVLYAIIKEETVVTVLPQGHGEEILQRGQAMEQRVAAGQPMPRPPDREDDRWDHRRRWRKEGSGHPVVIERIVRNGPQRGEGTAEPAPAPAAQRRPAVPPPAPEPTPAIVAPEPEPEPADAVAPEGPVADAIRAALNNGRRRAAVEAIREALAERGPDAQLLPLWNEIAAGGAPAVMTVGDLIEAVRGLSNLDP